MELVKWQNGAAPTFSNILNEFFGKDPFESASTHMVTSTVPAINIQETDKHYKLEVAAPGMKKENFNVSVDNDKLIISSELKSEKSETSDGRYTRKEFSFGSFRRQFTLPDSVDSSKIEAKYQDGMLNIVLPKREDAGSLPGRVIEIE